MMPVANNAFTPAGLIRWQCRAELRNDTPLHCQKNKLSLQKTTRRKGADRWWQVVKNFYKNIHERE
jgi:hypothetical protein